MNQLSKCCNAEIVYARNGTPLYCKKCGNKDINPTPPTSTEVDKLDEAFAAYLGGTPDPDEYSDWLEFRQAITRLITQAELRTLQKWEFAIEAGVNLEQQIDTIKKRIAELQAQLTKEDK